MNGLGGGSPLPVYLIHWGKPDWCRDAVLSLQKSTGVSLVISVIDNGAPDGSSLMGSLPPSVRVVPMPVNRGFAGAANEALADADAAPFCLIGSHDLHVAPGTISRLLTVAAADERLGVIAPALTEPFASSGGCWTGRRAFQLPLERSEGIVDRDWASGTCLLIRSECARAVGGFDESFGSYVEDVDFCLRARDAGWKVAVVTDAYAWGLGSADPGTATALMIANGYRLARKRRGAIGAMPVAGAAILQFARSLAACALPRRTASQRGSSRAAARAHAQALRHLMSR